MGILIASDIHGSAHWCRKLVGEIGRLSPERVLLLGDILYHGPRNDLPDEYAPKEVIPMLNAISDKIICVRGNCDTEVDQMVLDFPVLSDSAYICAYGERAFATHGHIFNPDSLPKLADGDIFLFGHTHVPMDEVRVTAEGKKIRCINPGSVSIPKNGSAHRCLWWDENGFKEIVLGSSGGRLISLAY